MRFIHTADIHLDSPLTGLSAYQDAPADLLRNATREAFENLVSEAISEKVDFMVIAGDLYDGSWKDFNTGIFFARQMGRLAAEGIPVYLQLGNHDAENEIAKKLELPSNVHKFPSNKAVTFKIPELRVALHGRSFKEAATTENIALGYPAPVPDWFNIGVLHTALEGNTVHANYAPCSVAELEAKGYQYWALGHVHEHRIISGASTIAFPGNLQGRHIRETGARGALLVTVSDLEIESIERLHTDVLRWKRLDVDASGCANMSEVVRQVGRALEQALADTPGDMPLAIRVSIQGHSEAHGELFGLEVQLRQEVVAQAVAIGADRIWIEKVRVETMPLQAPQDIAARADAVSDLQALLAKSPEDEAFLKSLHEELMTMVGKLPLEVLAALPELEDIRDGRLQSLLQATAPSLVDHVAKAS